MEEAPSPIRLTRTHGSAGRASEGEVGETISLMEEECAAYNERALARGATNMNLTYGHFQPALVTQMLDGVGCGPLSHVVDIGSGVGTICMQAAAQYGCAATGIEIRADLHAMATSFARTFEREVRTHGWAAGPVTLLCGNVTQPPEEMVAALRAATIIVMNNKVWDEELTEPVYALLRDHLAVGAVIITTRSYPRPKQYKFADSVVSRLAFPPITHMSGHDAVSWAYAPIEYYVYRVVIGAPLGLEISSAPRRGAELISFPRPVVYCSNPVCGSPNVRFVCQHCNLFRFCSYKCSDRVARAHLEACVINNRK